MILSKIAIATLILHVATGPTIEPTVGNLSVHQKQDATRVYVRLATDCIVRSVAADARFRRENPASNLGDLIVDSMPKCLDPVHAMIDFYDQSFGEGAGEEFFMGTYLDVLPDAVLSMVKRLPD
jgi:hypothetical protein